MSKYVCNLCESNEVFNSKEELKKHILTHHKDVIERVLSKIRPDKLENLEKRGINPKNWAVGYIIAFGAGKKID